MDWLLFFDFFFSLWALFHVIYSLFVRLNLYIVMFAVCGYFLYPLLLEFVANLIAACCQSDDLDLEGKQQKMNSSCGLIYSKDYNITCGGIEKRHPFDSTKYMRIIDILSNKYMAFSGENNQEA